MGTTCHFQGTEEQGWTQKVTSTNPFDAFWSSGYEIISPDSEGAYVSLGALDSQPA